MRTAARRPFGPLRGGESSLPPPSARTTRVRTRFSGPNPVRASRELSRRTSASKIRNRGTLSCTVFSAPPWVSAPSFVFPASELFDRVRRPAPARFGLPRERTTTTMTRSVLIPSSSSSCRRRGAVMTAEEGTAAKRRGPFESGCCCRRGGTSKRQSSSRRKRWPR